MNVSVCIPTRGDVDLSQIIASYDGIADEVLIWDNSKREDLAVYGRYAMIAEARNEFILTQDDDVLLTAVGVYEMIRAHSSKGNLVMHDGPESYVTCNMPERFRHSFYADHALVGFGAVFQRDLPVRAFDHYKAYVAGNGLPPQHENEWQWFKRTCDIVFTGLTPRVLVDVPYTDLPWASTPDRMWKQPEHVAERQRMHKLVKQIRDATKADT